MQGLGLDPADFDANELLLAMADYPIHDQALTQEGTTDKPAKFKLENWEEWSELIINYLKGQKSVNPGRALSYVLRIEPRPATMLPSVFNNIIYNAPLVGAAYEADNIKVHTVLVELTTGTPAADWIKQYSRAQDGRGAWLALVRHYDGASEGTRRVSAAKNDLELCRYSNEFTFPFEQYITNLKRCYTTLEKYGEARTERDKIDSLLNKINTSHSGLIANIEICRGTMNTFEDAAQYLSEKIAQLFPNAVPGSLGHSKASLNGGTRKVASVHKKGQGKGGGSKTSTVFKKNGKLQSNGVDLSDVTRYFTREEFQKMGPNGRDYLKNNKKRIAYKEKRSGERGQDNSFRSVSGISTSQMEQLQAGVINGVIAASAHMDDASRISGVSSGSARMPQAGPHARGNRLPSTIGAATIPRFNHLGDIVQE